MGVIRLFCFAACASAALLGPAARAGNYEYNFNTDPHGWTAAPGTWEWTEQSSNEKSWKLFVTGSNPSANYLYSPCFTIDATTVGFDFNEHRFKFGFSGTSGSFPYVPPAGQVQYSINGGAWAGVPLADWISQGTEVLPTLDPAALSSGTTDLLTSGAAFQDTSLDYAAGKFIKSSFDLTGLTVGGTIQFRLLGDLGYTALPPDALNPIWDVDNVQIKGVEPCVVPEPGGLALAAAAAVVAGCAWRRRLRRRRRHVDGRRAGAIGLMLTILLCGAVPARAVPIATYDFSIDGQGWTSETFTYFSPSTPVGGSSVNRWIHSAAADVWEVDPQAVFSPAAWIVNTLTSPVLTVPPTGVDAFEFVIRHRFNFPTNITTGRPVVAGQVAYRFYDPANLNAPFQPFLPATFASGGVPPPYQSFSPWPSWVPSTYTVGSFGVPPLLATGGGWQGQSPGWLADEFVLSQVTLDGGLDPGQQVQFRFLNANLGVECTGGGWDVSRVQVVGVLPEPGAIALVASAGGVGGLLGLARCRRRRHQRASSPSVSPLTNTLPAVSVD